ncbi:uncharacterized protein LOC128558485 isoform X2 [Mercenaria mercenaria]|uniref:uncharacterized protein LOC128558485 isoform X2 n=1 Tax=Mercenaria mercenaria TaxID=6596 RepID=UPI00234EC2AB|nr:uncharacterized protein LOC128558485 isoform X2 [Mercenaria mercenaria]
MAIHSSRTLRKLLRNNLCLNKLLRNNLCINKLQCNNRCISKLKWFLTVMAMNSSRTLSVLVQPMVTIPTQHSVHQQIPTQQSVHQQIPTQQSVYQQIPTQQSVHQQTPMVPNSYGNEFQPYSIGIGSTNGNIIPANIAHSGTQQTVQAATGTNISNEPQLSEMGTQTNHISLEAFQQISQGSLDPSIDLTLHAQLGDLSNTPIDRSRLETWLQDYGHSASSQHEISRLIHGSLADSTHKTYNSGLRSFENFRDNMNYVKQWPPTVQQLQEYIACLSQRGYAHRTVGCHIAAIGFTFNINGLLDTTQHFKIRKMLEGMKRLQNRSDARKPISFQLLLDLYNSLRFVCTSFYETLLFKTAFQVAFLAC